MNYEKVILVDSVDRVIGNMEKIEAHRKGLLHRAVSVFVFNMKGEWLLQQRAKHKYHSSLLWSNAACTHPAPGENTIDAAKRRLYEEIGIITNLHFVFSFTYKAELENQLIEHEFDHVFIGFSNSQPILNPNEIHSYRYISFNLLKSEITNRPDKFTVWFRLIYERVYQHLLFTHKLNSI